MTDTVGYYNRNAARYVADTVEVDLSALHQRFLAQVPPEEQAHAQAEGCERFEGFVETLGNCVQQGRAFFQRNPQGNEDQAVNAPHNPFRQLRQANFTVTPSKVATSCDKLPRGCSKTLAMPNLKT